MQEKILNILKILVAVLMMVIMGTIGSVLRMISFGLLTNFNRKYLLPFFCRIVLWMVGMRVENRVTFKLPAEPHFITFNHNSFLDAFVLMQLGFTDVVFFLSSGFVKKMPIVLLPAFAIGVRYIPTKDFREKRLAFFKKMEKIISRKKIHIMASSEGVHDYLHGIAEFNRGVYHMALNCKMPVVALFLYIPRESNPFNDYSPFKNGTLRVELIDVVDTKNWKLEELDERIEEVRQLYVDRFEAHEKGELK